MKLALMSDVHANIRALEACLEHAEQHGAQRHALLGDLVGYGAEPDEVVDRVMQLSMEGAIVIKGNHDEMAVKPPIGATTMGNSTAAWTHAHLSMEHRSFLAELPMTSRVESCLLVHASADRPEQWSYVDDERSAAASLDAAAQNPEIRYVFGGHVHHQTLYFRGTGRGLMRFAPTPGVAVPVPRHRHWIATIGSVGQPRDGQRSAMYAMFDTSALQLTFYRVPYDHMAAAAAIRRSGLPEYFAQRLEDGR